MNLWGLVDPRLLLDVLFASALGFLFFSRVNELRTLWLLRGYLFLVSLAWFVQRFANLPITSKLFDALVLAFEDVSRALKLSPSHPGALLERGIIARLQGWPDNARQDWLALLRLHEGTPAAEAAKRNLEMLDVKSQ